MSAAPLPLAGIRVVDYTHFLAGPYLSRCLAGLGADVIKVERPKAGDAGRVHAAMRDGHSGYFLQQNMGKRGLCVNMKDPRGFDLVNRLVAKADVFVENYRPGALDKLGLGFPALSKSNPRLVYCSVSAYGHTGPDAERPGFGVIAEAKSGAMAMLGVPGEPPPLFRMPIADMYAGIHGVAAVCAALVGRAVTGKGRHVDTALYDCMVGMHDFAVQCYSMSGGKELPVQTGHDLPQSTLYGVFRARDGDLVIAAQVDDAWKRLARVIGGDALAADTRFHTSTGRNAHREEILAKVKGWVAERSVRACLAELDAADVPAAPVQNIDQVIADPQVKARGMIVEQEHPVLGKVQLANVPFRFSDCDVTPRRVAPSLGEHNREIAEELGFAAAEIDAMQREGVLYAEAAARAPAAA
ncbi:MAG: CoA transferase [Burkholderiales bacterium]|jgi:crotonobetainyl-CoA:carnitine CoA-transferase CaiB-like acyl-CoA transferase|nr:CoA transferase [Burkholderiales bacterium]